MDGDDVTLMAHCWAVEFAEFDGFTRKTSAERLKAFISRTTDICQRKYGKGTERIPRRSVFWGTANRSPLTDRTGSTRFCLIDMPDKKLPLARVSLDRDASLAPCAPVDLGAFFRNRSYVQSEAEEAAALISPETASGGPCLPSSKSSAPLLVSSTLEPGKRACAIFCAACPGSMGRTNTGQPKVNQSWSS